MKYLKNSAFLFLLSLSIMKCQTKADGISNQETVLIYNVSEDSLIDKYIQQIEQLPEFKKWEYNLWNTELTQVIGTYDFEARLLSIQGNRFYHIELTKQRNNKPTDSFFYPTDLVCYFRIDPKQNNIKILNQESNAFLNMATEEGREYFSKLLTGRTK